MPSISLTLGKPTLLPVRATSNPSDPGAGNSLALSYSFHLSAPPSAKTRSRKPEIVAALLAGKSSALAPHGVSRKGDHVRCQGQGVHPFHSSIIFTKSLNR